MSYTVKKLSKFSKVSVRTLHYYDEINLLKPAYVGENQYRYYEEEQLLILQQILFFRALGFELNDIKKVLNQPAFDKMKALENHKIHLQSKIDHFLELMHTVDETIAHLKGKIKLENRAFYYGFDFEKQPEYEQYLVNYYGMKAEKKLLECQRRTAKWGSKEWEFVKEEGDRIYHAIVALMKQGRLPQDHDVQILIDAHYNLVNRFYNLTDEIYLELAELYQNHPEFSKFFEAYDKDLLVYFVKSMQLYIAQKP